MEVAVVDHSSRIQSIDMASRISSVQMDSDTDNVEALIRKLLLACEKYVRFVRCSEWFRASCFVDCPGVSTSHDRFFSLSETKFTCLVQSRVVSGRSWKMRNLLLRTLSHGHFKNDLSPTAIKSLRGTPKIHLFRRHTRFIQILNSKTIP